MAGNTQVRLGVVLFAVVVTAAASFALGRRGAAPSGGNHRDIRQIVVNYTVARIDDPIIVLGDSIVEAATLPPSACGHPIVNAGLAGATTGSDLSGWLKGALGTRRPYAIIVSLGVNDALTLSPPATSAAFAGRYEALLHELSKLTERLFIIEFPPVEARGPFTPAMAETAMAAITGYRAALPKIAHKTTATLLPLPPLEAPFTLEGIHLNTAGYGAWDKAIQRGTELACG